MVSNLIDKLKKNKKTVWSIENIKGIFNFEEDDVYSAIGKRQYYTEICEWINRGYFQIEVDFYPSYDLESSNYSILKNKLNCTTEEEENIFKKIRSTTKYSDVMYMKYHAWKWMKNNSDVHDIEYKSRNFSFISSDKKVIVQVFNKNPKHFVNSFLKGAESYVIVPLSRDKKKSPIFIFKKNAKLEEFLATKKVEEKEIKTFFLRTKTRDKHVQPKTLESDSVLKGNLVTFKHGGIIKRGILLEQLDPGRLGLIEAVKAYREEMEFYYQDNRDFDDPGRLLGLKPNGPKMNWAVDKKLYNSPRLFIKTVKETTKSAIYTYLVIEPQDLIETYNIIPLGQDLKKSVGNVIKRSQAGHISIEVSDEQEKKMNAAYDPKSKRIILYVSNMLQLCHKRYIHEGIKPVDTIQMLIAHEMGHADPESQHLYTDEFYEVINEINFLNEELVKIDEGLRMCSIEKELISNSLEKYEKLLYLVERYNELNLRGERDAFEYGRKLLSSDILPFFEKESYENYLGYVKEAHEKLSKVKSRIDTVRNSLPSYEKFEWDKKVVDFSNLFK